MTADEVEMLSVKLDRLTDWFTGDGDPKSGLLFKFDRLADSVEAHHALPIHPGTVGVIRQAIADVARAANSRPGRWFWRRLAFDSLRAVVANVLTLVVLATLTIFALGARVSLVDFIQQCVQQAACR